MRGSIATNSPMTMIMNRLVNAPNTVPTAEVSRPTDPIACCAIPLRSARPGISPMPLAQAIRRLPWISRVERSCSAWAAIWTPVK